jgi:DNA-binding MarR family transcriptional regulator
MVDRLEAEGLVRRTLDPADRRVILAELTDEGRRRQAAGAARIRTLERQMERTIGSDDRSAIGRALRALE